MKVKSLMAVLMFALIFFACGEVGNSDASSDDSSSSDGISSGGGGNSSGGTGSSSSNENVVCTGNSCCNGAEYNPQISFCYTDSEGEELLYPLCANKTYNPYEQGCFEGQLYPKCELSNTRGVCVHNSLKRCRQEGEGERYIIDPLPGMICENNGAITGEIMDISDNYKRYKTVQIGRQVWIAENVKREAIEILVGENLESVPIGECYDGESSNCDEYGRMYNWCEIMYGIENFDCAKWRPAGNTLYPGICPAGFYVPQSADWQELVNYAGGNSIAGSRLKSKTGWSNNGNGTDSYGFNALSGGYRAAFYLPSYNELGSRSIWWTSGVSSDANADYWDVISSDTEARSHFQSKNIFASYLRCMRY